MTATDSTTGGQVEGARLISRSGTYADTAGPDPGRAVLTGAPERPGTYDLLVEAPGYAPWARSDVRVTADHCHVRPVSLLARLQRT